MFFRIISTTSSSKYMNVFWKNELFFKRSLSFSSSVWYNGGSRGGGGEADGAI